VKPFAIQILKDVYRIDASNARSKSWEEYEDLEFDFVITVCDDAPETWSNMAGATDHRSLVKS